MYRLLLVTDKKDIQTLYNQYSHWEDLGFEHPSVAANAEEGIDCLSNQHFDAVSWLLPVKEGKVFFNFLSSQRDMLGMDAVRDDAKLHREISKARRELASRDAERSSVQLDDVTQVMQWDFMYRLLEGTKYTHQEVEEELERLKMQDVDPTRPVATASLRLPQGDYFLSEVWKYGRERLENALKNIFEISDDAFNHALLILNPHHMRLIAVPKRDVNENDCYVHMMAYLATCRHHLEQYFELSLNIKQVVTYSSLYQLIDDNINH